MSDDLQTPPVRYQRAPTPGGVASLGWLEVEQSSPGELILLSGLATKDSRLGNVFVIILSHAHEYLNSFLEPNHKCNEIYLFNLHLYVRIFLSTDTVLFVSEDSEIIQLELYNLYVYSV